MTRAATYARYSTDRQSDKSLEDQARNCRERAAREGWTIAATYADRGISGATSNRPGYQDMLAAALAGEFEALIVDDMSRLARDEIETQLAVRRLRLRGIRVIGANDGFDSDAKGYRLQAGLRGLMHAGLLEIIRDQTHRGLTGRALKGLSAGGRVYGYKLIRGDEGTRLEVDPIQAEVVREIFARYAAGQSHRRIAGDLNRRRVPPPRGKSWSATTIYGDTLKGVGMLVNATYTGRLTWNRSRWERDPDTGRRRRLARPESEWITTEAPELRIVDEQTWDLVQQRHRRNRRAADERRHRHHNRAGPGRGPKHIFSGLLRCGRCGSSFTMMNAREYGCSFHRNRGEAVCSNDIRVARRLVEDRLLTTIVSGLFTADAVAGFRDEVRRRLTTKDVEAERRSLAEELGRARREAENLVQAIQDGVRAELVKDALERCDRRRVEIERRLAALDRSGSVGALIPGQLDGFADALAGLRRLADQDVDAARDQLRRLVGEIRLLPYEGHLVAHLSGDLVGLLGLTADATALLLWRQAELTAGFGRFEGDDLTDFRVVEGSVSENMVAGGAQPPLPNIDGVAGPR